MTDLDAGQLAEIVRRDAAVGTGGGGSFIDAIEDRRALLGLLRETRDWIDLWVILDPADPDGPALLNTLAALEGDTNER